MTYMCDIGFEIKVEKLEPHLAGYTSRGDTRNVKADGCGRDGKARVEASGKANREQIRVIRPRLSSDARAAANHQGIGRTQQQGMVFELHPALSA